MDTAVRLVKTSLIQLLHLLSFRVFVHLYITGACGERGKCYDLPGNRGYRCACPVGRTGERCERGIKVSEPAFNRSSYIAYPTIDDALMEATITLMFKVGFSEDTVTTTI